MRDETKTEVTAAMAVVDEQLVAELARRAQAGGVAMTGEGGLLRQLTKGRAGVVAAG